MTATRNGLGVQSLLAVAAVIVSELSWLMLLLLLLLLGRKSTDGLESCERVVAYGGDANAGENSNGGG